ncbi:hypothetical protein DID97_15040 [Burkholderia sp. Bp8977]|nr:hypothetical protein DIE10_14865 [Burkholderia sp. Bp9011]RQR92020.1 hypothetical protein DIE09_17090 [Burkholderia sp. Bp9010]RQS05964.1 hypothetical protein DIE02_14735 [Burkholderia sp. Bp8991]RQS76467.1 hypothetical protein DID97_15040 [Burkholderia sp. Bp8977]
MRARRAEFAEFSDCADYFYRRGCVGRADGDDRRDAPQAATRAFDTRATDVACSRSKTPPPGLAST